MRLLVCRGRQEAVRVSGAEQRVLLLLLLLMLLLLLLLLERVERVSEGGVVAEYGRGCRARRERVEASGRGERAVLQQVARIRSDVVRRRERK